MKTIGENKIANADVNDYCGVDSHANPPFGYNIAKAPTSDGFILCAFAAFAMDDTETAADLAAKIESIDSANFFLYLLRTLL